MSGNDVLTAAVLIAAVPAEGQVDRAVLSAVSEVFRRVSAALASVAAVASWFFVALMNRSAIRAIRGSGVSSLTGCLQARSAGLRSSRSAPQAVRTDPRPSRSPDPRAPLRGAS